MAARHVGGVEGIGSIARQNGDVVAFFGIEMDLAVWANNRGDFSAALTWTRAAVSSAENAANDPACENSRNDAGVSLVKPVSDAKLRHPYGR